MTTLTPHRPPARTGRDGFGPVLHAEWTKFRTVRGWVIGLAVAVVITAGLGVLIAVGTTHNSCEAQTPNGTPGPVQHGAACGAPTFTPGPGGEPVRDDFTFVRQPLAGHGSLTVRVTSLTGVLAGGGGPGIARRGTVPWSKAGIIITGGTRQGAAYAAMMVTGGHGVRMQWDYTGDTAGLPGTVSAARPRWLRLTRHGDTITGSDSATGTNWTTVGTVTLAHLPATVQAGLFVTSPQSTSYATGFASGSTSGSPTTATGVFDDVHRAGAWPDRAWAGDQIGAGDIGTAPGSGGYTQAGGRFTVTGSGDIAPDIAGPGEGLGGPAITVSDYLLGVFIGLIVVSVVAAMFMTAEYRRGLIRTTLAASPARGRVLAAKAVVIGAAAFVAGLAAAAGAIFAGLAIERGSGFSVFPEPVATQWRMVAGIGVMAALVAVFTLGVATVVRRSAATILIAIVAVVVPYFLSFTSAVPPGVADWLLRITPAAAFATEQAAPQYYQVVARYAPSNGYYPLAPWAGLAVLCGWAALALILATWLLRRRDV